MQRRKRMRNRFSIGLAMVLLVSVLAMGCPRVVEPEPVEVEPWRQEIVIGWTPPDITGVFITATEAFEAGVEDAWFAGFNVRLITRSAPTHVAFADQVAIIEDYIAMGVDVIAISPIEVAAVTPAIRKANEAGIPVIFVNLLEPVAGVEAASYIGFDNEEAAMVTAYSVLDQLGGPGVLGTGEKVAIRPGEFLDLAWWEALYADLTPEERAAIEGTGAIIEGIAGGFFSMARVRGFRRVVDEFPGIEIVATLATNWSRVEGRARAEDILKANPPGTLDFIWAASNELGIGAMLAVEAAGRQAEVPILSQGITAESATRIREGRIVAETTHGFRDWGWHGTEFAVRAALGLEVPPLYDIRPRTVFKGNVHEFHPHPALPPIDWDSIKAEAEARR